MLAALVRAHAASHPDQVAVVAGSERVTYAEFDRRISRWRAPLRTAGIGRGSLVGIYTERGVDTIAALLAVLGEGAAYTVFEPTDPVSEGIRRLGLASPDLVLTTPEQLTPVQAVGLAAATKSSADDDFPIVEVDPDDTAYVLHTSGSTGVPKGVLVTHANIRHYTESLLDRLGITEPLSYAHVTTLVADLGNTSLFLALWTGGTLHVVGDERRDPVALLNYLTTERVDFVKTTPSHWGAVFRAYSGSSLRLRFLLLGGELLSPRLARSVLASGVTRTLVNHYGPTETTVGVATCSLTTVSEVDELVTASVPIGSALGRTRLLVRAEDGTLRERDAEGELYVAGPSVTAGYRADEAATAAAFTEEAGVGRVYRTGDRVRADRDGVLEFLGRGDRQVKVGGFRVELGHVESGLRALPGVEAAVVIHRSGDRPALLAAVAGVNVTDPRTALRAVLPAHMIPQRVEVLDALPRTGNGKVDEAAVRELLERDGTGGGAAEDQDDPVLAEVLAVWRRHVGHREFGPHDEFSGLGGSSIDAIGIIADLQAGGHVVSADSFLATTTAAAMAEQLRHGNAEPARPTRALPADDRALSPAQQWFFRQDFAQPDQWNQALLLDVTPEVRAAELTSAINEVVAAHPLLHTAFRAGRRELVPPVESVTVSHLTDDPQRDVRTGAAERQAEIRIADGVVFRAHLFLGAGRAHLLLVAHHLCVDAVSWRVVVNDISRRYGERLRGQPPRTPALTTDFGTWATLLRSRADDLRADLAHWEGFADGSAPRDGGNVEGDAEAVWFALSSAETEKLGAGRAQLSPPAVLLAAFAQALAELDGVDHALVDVESHGRETFGDAVEVSRAVGWFTSTFPVRVDVSGPDVTIAAKCAAAALDDVPHLGVAYGLHGLPRLADACFNYLGALALPYADDLRPTYSRLSVGPVRGARNDRGYSLKLTARVHDGQLVADLSYSPGRCSRERAMTLARATREYLGQLTGPPAGDGQFVVESCSTTGLFAQLPTELRLEPASRATRDYRTVLLTGATGFIGAHLLHLLLTRTSAHVHCLVRPTGGTALDRLRAAYSWAVPGDDLDQYADRVTVHAGDLTAPRFALPEPDHRALCREVEAIYHSAADTRLFGDRDTFATANVEPVRALINLAGTGRPKDLHHISTLAVCGAGPDGPREVFSEDSLDLGQRFLNEYERSKFAAERLVADFAAQGGTAFVYRSGDVTGHSTTGRFQRNGGQNRLVQVLRAAVVLGRVPSVAERTLTLSPVDVVAAGVLAISRDAPVHGGTFHVDSDQVLTYGEVFAVLRELGRDLAEVEAPDFAALFAGHQDERLRLAHFWANRPERNVRYDHTRTHRLLAELGVEFPTLDRGWLRAFLAGLIDQGELEGVR